MDWASMRAGGLFFGVAFLVVYGASSLVADLMAKLLRRPGDTPPRRSRPRVVGTVPIRISGQLCRTEHSGEGAEKR